MKSIPSTASFACVLCLLLVSVAQGQDYLSGEDTLCNGLPCKSGDITTTTTTEPTDGTVAADSDSTNNDYVYAEVDRVDILFIGDRDTTTDSNSNNPNYLDSDVESVPTPSTFSPDY